MTLAQQQGGTADTEQQAIHEVIIGWVVANMLPVIITFVVATVLWFVLRRLIRRVTNNAVRRAAKDRPTSIRDAEHTAELSEVLMSQRREQRAKALGQLLSSVMAFTIFGVAILVALTELGINIAPLMASAGVVGVALGFGAQTLVKDFLSGIFLVIEDQYGPGDFVDLGAATGTIEEVTLRVTRLRDLSGVVWYVRNGEILRVGNRSQGWTMATVDVPVAYNEDLERVRRIVEEVGVAMAADSRYDAMLYGPPSYGGVESVTGDAVFIRVFAKAAPDQQMATARAVREELKAAFDAAGVRVPVLARPAVPGMPGTTPPAAPPA
jgi:small conductance mechanosensitive channel